MWYHRTSAPTGAAAQKEAGLEEEAEEGEGGEGQEEEERKTKEEKEEKKWRQMDGSIGQWERGQWASLDS